MRLAIIFDLDGTLIDTPTGIVQAFTAALNSMDISFKDDSAIRATIGLPLERAFSNLLQVPENDARVNVGIKKYQALFKDIVLPRAKELIFPAVLEGLRSLKTEKISLAVATSKVYKSAEALLKAADLWQYFDIVIGADQVKQPKPHPEMGKLIMKKFDVLAKDTVMVGDTTHDIQMANASGMHSIAVTYGVHDIEKLKTANPTWLADTFNDVHKICASFKSDKNLLLKS